MLPGQHLILIGSETDALSARAAGLQVRDTLLILLPGPKTLTAFLLRQPLDGTIAETILKYGTGGLHINATRIGYNGKSLDQVRKEAGSPTQGTGTGRITNYAMGSHPVDFHPSGRWPTNLVLVHSPHCIQAGTKSVNVTPSRWKHYTETPKASSNTYAQDAWTKEHFMTSGVTHDANGSETVPAWTCSPDCPVRLLDERSGICGGRWGKNASVVPSGAKNTYGTWEDARTRNPDTYGDAGTASRFYPQFPSLQDALHWLATLISPPAHPSESEATPDSKTP